MMTINLRIYKGSDLEIVRGVTLHPISHYSRSNLLKKFQNCFRHEIKIANTTIVCSQPNIWVLNMNLRSKTPYEAN